MKNHETKEGLGSPPMTEHQNTMSHYLIRGGADGRERLRLLSGVMRPYALRLFDRLDICEGMSCLDLGCGGGDVTLELARIVGRSGKVVGMDLDSVKLDVARSESKAQGFKNEEFRLVEENHSQTPERFDFVFARFLLTHVPKPAQILRQMLDATAPGGLLAVVDVDFSGYFCYPDCPALWQYVQLYTETVRRCGGAQISVGYLVAPVPLVDKFAAARLIMDRHSAVIDQAIMCDFITDGHFGRHIRRMREI
jgi:SAM-dependent methyltransferase